MGVNKRSDADREETGMTQPDNHMRLINGGQSGHDHFLLRYDPSRYYNSALYVVVCYTNMLDRAKSPYYMNQKFLTLVASLIFHIIVQIRKAVQEHDDVRHRATRA